MYEYKYAIVNADGTTAAAWQSGGNAVVALRWGEKEVEVYDNWWGLGVGGWGGGWGPGWGLWGWAV